MDTMLQSTNISNSGSLQKEQKPIVEEMFYYFAYGSCMCPVDLQRTMKEPTHHYVVGPALIKGYRLGFYLQYRRRNCGALDIVKDPKSHVEGVLYHLPQRMINLLDQREEVCFNHHQAIHVGSYRPERVEVFCKGQRYSDVRTYTVVNKLPEELAPNDWYFNVVMRGAITCGLTEEYCWKLFQHMYSLQKEQLQYHLGSIQASISLKSLSSD
ncbi:gamma-glutamylcyclotransferase [Limnoraphis robusta]